MMSVKFEVKIKRLEEMRAAYLHALTETPEKDAWQKMVGWAIPEGLFEKGTTTRVFGRNTYPTENPEPHGYGFFITLDPSYKPKEDVEIRKIPGGLYAVLRFKGLEKIGEAWPHIFKWVEDSEYELDCWTKSEYGYEGGFEEHINWYDVIGDEGAPTEEWIFGLWVQLKE